jgi:hypothetical protein
MKEWGNWGMIMGQMTFYFILPNVNFTFMKGLCFGSHKEPNFTCFGLVCFPGDKLENLSFMRFYQNG